MIIKDWTEFYCVNDLLHAESRLWMNRTYETRNWGNTIVSMEPFYAEVNRDMELLALDQVGYGENRWKQFMRDYLDMDSLVEWLRAIRTGHKMSHNAYPFHEKGRHRYSNCISLLSYRRAPASDQLVLISRTCRFPATAAMDVALLVLIGQMMPTDCQLFWHIIQPTFSLFHGFTYLNIQIENGFFHGTPLYEKFLYYQNQYYDYRDRGVRYKFATSNRYYEKTANPYPAYVPEIKLPKGWDEGLPED